MTDTPATNDDHLEATRAYYDEFAHRYEDRRDGRDPSGYHDMLDDLELGFLRRFAEGRDVLEVGCGTGLLLRRMAKFARSAKGVDLSPGMLERARARGLDVTEASATSLPFADASFDVACSFKVLAHVRDVQRALAEMARVVRPGGTIWLVLHPLSRVLRAFGAAVQRLDWRTALARLYVLANGAASHWLDREFRAPFGDTRESFQTPERIRARLAALGFERIETRERPFFVVTARKPFPRGGC